MRKILVNKFILFTFSLSQHNTNNGNACKYPDSGSDISLVWVIIKEAIGLRAGNTGRCMTAWHDKDGTEEVTFTWRGAGDAGGNVLTPLCKPRVQSTPVFTMPALKVTIYILIDINEHFVSLYFYKTQKYAWRWK